MASQSNHLRLNLKLTSKFTAVLTVSVILMLFSQSQALQQESEDEILGLYETVQGGQFEHEIIAKSLKEKAKLRQQAPFTPWVTNQNEAQVITYGNAYLRGSNANYYAANSTNCYNRLVYTYYHRVNLLQWRFYYGDFEDTVYNSTQFFSNATNAVMVCYDVFENFAHFASYKFKQFGSFPTLMTSFFQNLIGNAIVLTRYQKQFTDLSNNKNYTGIAELAGKLVVMLLDFPPIESAALRRIFRTKQNPIKLQQQEEFKSQYRGIHYNETEEQEHIRLYQAANNNSNASAGAKQILSFAGIVSFLRGAVNGTKTTTSQNLTRCEEKVIKKWDLNAKKMVNYTKQGQLFNMGWAFLDMCYNLDNITQSCFQGFKEGGVGLEGYAKTQYPSSVMDNVVFNFGDIFDSIRDTILFFKSSSRGQFSVPYDAGYGLGYAVYEVMQPPTKPKPNKPF